MKIRRNLAIFSVVILLFSIISPGIAAQGVAACDAILADNRGLTPHVVDHEDFFKFGKIEILSNFFDRHKAEIVPGILVFLAWVAEADY